jgi:phosphoglycolate phosphatase-like HAD superfamily hydrolase
MNIGLDFDGTVVTCRARHVALMRASARRLGVALDAQTYWSGKRQGLSNSMALRAAGIEPWPTEFLCAMWLREVERYPWLGFDQPIDGVDRALETIVARGHQLHLISARTNAALLFMQLDRLGLRRLMASVTVVRQGNVAKDKAQALASRHCDFYVGDAESDHEAATRAGVPFAGVASGMRSEEFLHSLGVAWVRPTLGHHLDRLIHHSGDA